MEELLHHKEDQVMIFRDTLWATADHKLVENSWDSLWGCSCPFNCKALWTGTFKGANNLGQLLEKQYKPFVGSLSYS